MKSEAGCMTAVVSMTVLMIVSFVFGCASAAICSLVLGDPFRWDVQVVAAIAYSIGVMSANLGHMQKRGAA